MDASAATVPSHEADLKVLAEAVRAAGEVAMSHYGGKPKHWNKPDGSPVSEADLAVDAALSGALRQARPTYGLLSEEHASEPGAAPRTFVIDPIDGTRAFLGGKHVWSVVAAVIEDGRPVAAAVLEPVAGALYTARQGGGAARNGVPLGVTQRADLAGAEVAMPGPMFREGGLGALGIMRGAQVPSLALRLVRVAEARLDGVITKAGPHHWDLAAADLIVQEAGGTLTDLAGMVPRYDSSDTSHPPVVAASRSLADRLCHKAAAAYATVSG